MSMRTVREMATWHQARAAQARAALMARYRPCPACGNPQAGPVHRTSRQLWEARLAAARAQLAGARQAAADAQAHLDQIAEQEIRP